MNLMNNININIVDTNQNFIALSMYDSPRGLIVTDKIARPYPCMDLVGATNYGCTWLNHRIKGQKG
jgi:hypothetical protein